MRAFFYLLLLTNLLFLLVQWLYPYEQWAPQPRALAAAERLRLIDETETLAAEEVSGGENREATAVNPAVTVADRLCYTLGPFKEMTEAQEAARRFREAGMSVELRPSQEQEYMGMMVYIGPHESRERAVAVARELADKGVRDYIIFSDPDKLNSLSLGVFGLKKNAERRQAQLEKLGYDARSEPRYRQRTIYWLDYAETETGALRDWIAQMKAERGISRITRQCAAERASGG
jgi:cell division septation protein DedD